MTERLLDLLFPLACVACNEPVRGPGPRLGPLCDHCRTSAALPPSPLCPCCGVPRAEGLPGSASACAACRREQPAFATARGAALYDPDRPAALVAALHAFKYAGVRALARPLALLISERLPIPPDVVVLPVPLHRTRLRERRYNQAALLARAVAARHARPLLVRVLVRHRPTPPQTALGAAERRANLRAAFVVRRPDLVAGRRVLLVDDVITTGATADACARALRAAGARRIDAYAVGRTALAPHA